MTLTKIARLPISDLPSQHHSLFVVSERASARRIGGDESVGLQLQSNIVWHKVRKEMVAQMGAASALTSAMSPN